MPLEFHMPTWSQTKTTSKVGFDKVYAVVDKLGAPVNKLSNKLGSEAFWPTTLDKESDKAARILRSFCKDGFYVEEEDKAVANGDKPRGKQRVVKKIPTEVIRKAKGLAIFTTMRTGLWVSGAGGSGILVARLPDGSWSPPSGILLHTAGLGYLVGVDIYDCVVVINTEKALQAFTKIRCTLGGEISAVAGPVGIGGVLETEIHKRQAPVWNYLKSRGFYAGVQIDGTVIIQRQDENERFYGQKLTVDEILAGRVRHPPFETRTLMATIKAAQGDRDVDESALPAAEPIPSDYEVKDGSADGFGLPPSEDNPDPFGVHALEQEGLVIREAGTGSRPSGDAFEYKPSPSSPIYATFHARQHSRRDSGRCSIASVHTDRGTQTANFDGPITPKSQQEFNLHSEANDIPEDPAESLTDDDTGSVELGAPEIHERPRQTSVVSKAKLVTIPRRVPPTPPPRSPYRDPSMTLGTQPGSPVIQEQQTRGTSTTGLGIDTPASSAKHDSTNAIETQQEEDLEEKLEQIHLAPIVSHSTSGAVTPNGKTNGFDAVSLSGSEYSRATPAITPMHEPNERTIMMIDHEEPSKEQPDSRSDPTEHQMPSTNTPVTDALPAALPLPDTKASEDDFHSLPASPIESHETPTAKHFDSTA